MPNSHFEPYLYLAELSDTSVTIAWGEFFFWTAGTHPTDGDDFRLVDDEALKMINPPRKASIGASSEAYDRTGKGALVEVFEAASGQLAGSVHSRPDKNHAVVTGLAPDTEYTYKVTANDTIDWASGQLRDWTEENGFKGLKHSRAYDRRFRTNPDRDAPAGPVTLRCRCHKVNPSAIWEAAAYDASSNSASLRKRDERKAAGQRWNDRRCEMQSSAGPARERRRHRRATPRRDRSGDGARPLGT